MAAGILVIQTLSRGRAIHFCKQLGAGREVVVVIDRVRLHHKALVLLKARKCIDISCVGRVVPYDPFGAISAGCKSTVVVRNHQLVCAIAVREEIENAFVFKQAGDKIKRGFVVLHAVVTLRIGTRKFRFELDAKLVEHHLNNLWCALRLVDHPVSAQSQQPQ